MKVVGSDFSQRSLSSPNCFHIPRFLHILRTSPAFTEPAALQSTDSLAAHALSKFLNIEVTPKARQQITLPTRCGGLGIPSISETASSAFIASSMTAILLMESLVSAIPPCDSLQPIHLNDALKITASTAHLNSSKELGYIFKTEAGKPTLAGDWLQIITSTILDGFGPASREFINEIASRIATKTGDIRAHVHLQQRYCCCFS